MPALPRIHNVDLPISWLDHEPMVSSSLLLNLNKVGLGKPRLHRFPFHAVEPPTTKIKTTSLCYMAYPKQEHRLPWQLVDFVK